MLQDEKDNVMKARDFRANAWVALSGKWGMALGTTLVAMILGLNGSNSLNLLSRFTNKNDNDKMMKIWNQGGDFSQYRNEMITITTIFLVFIIIIVVIALIRFIISGAITIGYNRFCLNLVDGNNKACANNIFSGFHILGKALGLKVCMAIYTLLWTLLFIIPGIIAAYSYSMATYIMAENPDIGINEAISQSKEMMIGNKWRFFCLKISFIGWGILALFTCGIGSLWLNPYIFTAEAAFYREVSNTYPQKEYPVNTEYPVETEYPVYRD